MQNTLTHRAKKSLAGLFFSVSLGVLGVNGALADAPASLNSECQTYTSIEDYNNLPRVFQDIKGALGGSSIVETLLNHGAEEGRSYQACSSSAVHDGHAYFLPGENAVYLNMTKLQAMFEQAKADVGFDYRPDHLISFMALSYVEELAHTRHAVLQEAAGYKSVEMVQYPMDRAADIELINEAMAASVAVLAAFEQKLAMGDDAPLWRAVSEVPHPYQTVGREMEKAWNALPEAERNLSAETAKKLIQSGIDTWARIPGYALTYVGDFIGSYSYYIDQAAKDKTPILTRESGELFEDAFLSVGQVLPQYGDVLEGRDAEGLSAQFAATRQLAFGRHSALFVSYGLVGYKAKRIQKRNNVPASTQSPKL